MITEKISRVGRSPVSIPAGVKIAVANRVATVEGPKGKELVDVHPFIALSVEDNQVTVSYADDCAEKVRSNQKRLRKSLPATTVRNLKNAVVGVTELFEKKLKLIGVGYKAQGKGKVLSLSLGFSHPTDYQVPEGVTVETPVPTEIVVKGTNKELVGQVAAEIRKYRSPEPYKGKGVRYADEEVVKKEAKKK